jgi:hypothetical protein
MKNKQLSLIRKVILSIAVLGSLYLPFPAKGMNAICPDWVRLATQLGTEEYYEGVDSFTLEIRSSPSFWGRQRKSNWCWAATIQMLLNYFGVLGTQEDIVTSLFNRPIDVPTYPAAQVAAINRLWWHSSGKIVSAKAMPIFSPDQTIIRNHLKAKRPMLFATKTSSVGHMYLLSAAKILRIPALNYETIQTVVLRDPLPGMPSRQEMPWNKFVHDFAFLMSVQVR